jgi:hypothetical protein
VGCLGGCVRLLFLALWRVVLAAVVAVLLARIDAYIEGSSHRDAVTGRAWRMYRGRTGKKVRRGAPPGASSAIDTEGRPKT